MSRSRLQCSTFVFSRLPPWTEHSAWELYYITKRLPWALLRIYMGQELRKTGVRQLSIYS